MPKVSKRHATLTHALQGVSVDADVVCGCVASNISERLARSHTRSLDCEDAGGAFLATDADAAYISNGIEGGTVKRILKRGGTPTILAKTRRGGGGPVLPVGEDVYYCDGSLYRVNKHGGEGRRVSGSCGERLASLDGVIYASYESRSSGFGAHEDGYVTPLDSMSPEALFKGATARGLIAGGGALYFAARSEKQPRTTWFRFRPPR